MTKITLVFLSNYIKENQNMTDNDIEDIIPNKEIFSRKLYFVNEIVEDKLTRYKWTGCTNVALRDSIMSHASELIRQIIRKQGLNQIYPGQEESAFGDLLQTGYCQLERTLYKYRAAPHCRKCFNYDRPMDSIVYVPEPLDYEIMTFQDLLRPKKSSKYYGKSVVKCPKCKTDFSDVPFVAGSQGVFMGSNSVLFKGTSKVFNLWSQIARTVILAYIKKEGRDRKNSNTYKDHLTYKYKPVSGAIERFMVEARELCKYNDEYLKIIGALEKLLKIDDKPHDGIISKLMQHSGVSRPQVQTFLKMMRFCSTEFTDSPINRNSEIPLIHDRKRTASNDPID